MHLLVQKCNDTAPLFSISDMCERRMVIDYEEDSAMFTDNPNKWYKLPTSKKGLMMSPITNEAIAYHGMEPANNTECLEGPDVLVKLQQKKREKHRRQAVLSCEP